MSSSSSSSPQGHYDAAGAASASPSGSAKRGRAPASNKAILGLRQITAADCLSSSEECPICLQDFDFDIDTSKEDEEASGQLIRALPCSHTFHRHCITRWLRCNAVCPLCRLQLPTEGEEEEEEGKEDDDDDAEERRYRGRMRMGVSIFPGPTQEQQDFMAEAVAQGLMTEEVYEWDEEEVVDQEELWRAEDERWMNMLRESQLRATRHQS